ncbi:uncharacterized protein LOC129595512 [Paramacrobiotus metropolitanus]|uniref:uncharacterized protein LOC129595512 n=1 Tax=Paramacrobiotus metropolitanus TaxID=2943436 RepID=UPI002445689C|nr:uncharacterized protein LOC129595512 [Paramacrobiotus metropolitanus]
MKGNQHLRIGGILLVVSLIYRDAYGAPLQANLPPCNDYYASDPDWPFNAWDRMNESPAERAKKCITSDEAKQLPQRAQDSNFQIAYISLPGSLQGGSVRL